VVDVEICQVFNEQMDPGKGLVVSDVDLQLTEPLKKVSDA